MSSDEESPVDINKTEVIDGVTFEVFEAIRASSNMDNAQTLNFLKSLKERDQVKFARTIETGKELIECNKKLGNHNQLLEKLESRNKTANSIGFWLLGVPIAFVALAFMPWPLALIILLIFGVGFAISNSAKK